MVDKKYFLYENEPNVLAFNLHFYIYLYNNICKQIA